ncbi:MAG: phage tail protein [Roseomonas sp.]|jgi:phage tail-like protein|nr:phage tail protein [Roseomonas sp.]MCA3429138.1 phage tail protein [Roseomonas sp.]MCA3434739.1 phage tail protein [Roseomonas sp.]
MTLPLSSRFAVVFFALGVVPNPIDLRFQRVSGLSASISTVTVREGGQQLYTHRLPDMVSYENLVLERGFMVGSPLNIEFNVAFSLMKFAPSNVMITLLNEDAVPIAGWMFVQAFPVRWATADLDASRDEVLIDTLELAYTRMQAIRI